MLPRHLHKGKGKGKAPPGHRHASDNQSEERPTKPKFPPSAFIQAYEANLIYDEPEIAREQMTKSEDLPESIRRAGRGLLRWQGEGAESDLWADR